MTLATGRTPASRDVAQNQCARFLQAAGVLSVADVAQQLPGWRGLDAPQQWALDVTGPVVATGAQLRFAEPYCDLEIIAQAGTVIGWNDGAPVTTPYDDCVLVMPSTRQARASVTVLRFARRRAL